MYKNKQANRKLIKSQKFSHYMKKKYEKNNEWYTYDAYISDEKQEMLARRKRKAIWKWSLAYTLVNNPEISLQRRLVLAKERNENVKEIFLSHSAPFLEAVPPPRFALNDAFMQEEKL